MAFIPMTKKVRPWKRGLAGLGGASTRADLESKARMEDSIAASLIMTNPAEARAARARAASYRAQAEADLRAETSAGSGTVVRGSYQDPATQQAGSYLPPAVAAAREAAARAEADRIAAVTALANRPAGSVVPAQATRTAAPGNKAYDIKEDPRYYTKTVDANGNAVYRKVGSSSSSSFSDVLTSIAEVVGVAVPVADRIVQSEQQRKAETLARRAERAAQNGLISSPQPQGSGIRASTVAYGVGGLIAVGVTLWALSSLLGGGSSTPSVAVVKA